MQKLGKYVQHKITCIAKSMEKYISFNLDRIRFLDSCNFMSESLGNLVNNLATDGEKYFHHMKRHFPNEVERNLLIRKGVYVMPARIAGGHLLLEHTDETAPHLRQPATNQNSTMKTLLQTKWWRQYTGY